MTSRLPLGRRPGQHARGFCRGLSGLCRRCWSLHAPKGWAAKGCRNCSTRRCEEMLYASNHAGAMYTGIAHGAYLCLKTHAAPWLQARHGLRSSRSCLAHHVPDRAAGRQRCRAAALSRDPEGDDRYRLHGNKLFISGGEHDLHGQYPAPGAGASARCAAWQSRHFTFLVPKRLDDGQANGVRCDGIEHKMGIKGSATCSLVFDGAQGWLTGDAHRGLAAMFVMMNSARLHVGLQGLGHVEAAWQNARQYAAERL